MEGLPVGLVGDYGRSMKPAIAALFAVALFFAFSTAAGARGGLSPVHPPATSGQQAVADELIVQFKPGVSPSARGTARQAADVGVVKPMQHPGQQLLHVRAGQTVDGAIRALERDARVRYAQKNYVYTEAAIPNDSQFGQLWGMRNTGQPVHGNPGVAGTPAADIDAPSAWDRTTGSRNIVVAVVDSGVAYDHPDLVHNIWINDDPVNGIDDDGNGFVDDRVGWDFSPGSDDNDPYDLNEHGTHVAGTIGAEGDNGSGVAGVNWAVSIMPVRVLDAAGSGTSQTVADGFQYAGDNGARVVNASLGGPQSASDQVVAGAIAAHPNTLYVVAAGNGGADGVGDNNDVLPQSPCNLSNANLVCVAATTSTDGLAGFSNFGATSVDLGAPGTDILSTVPAFVFWDDFEGSLANWAATTWTRTSATSSMGSSSMADSVGNYAPNANAILQTAAAVPGSGGCPLTFDLRMHTPDTGDGLFVDVSTNGTVWVSLGSISGNFGPDFFPLSAGDLPTGPDVFIRFRFVADGDVTVGDGVYVDNVKVGCVDDAATPDASDLAFFDGTSMATPHVTGAAALALALAPGTSVAQLKSALLSSGDPDPALAGKTVSGRRLNVANLLNTISPPPPPDGGGGGGGTPAGGGGTGAGTPLSGGTALSGGTQPGGGTTSPPANLLGTVSVKRCSQARSGRKVSLRCALGHAGTVTSATIRLKKGSRTVAKGTGKPSSGGTLKLKLKRKLAKRRYTLALVLRDAAGHTRTLTFKFRIR